MHCFVLFVIDLSLVAISNIIAILLCTEHPLTGHMLSSTLAYAGLTIAAAIPVFIVAGTNRTLWRFTSLHDCLRLLFTVTATIVIATTAADALSLIDSVPRSLPVLEYVLMIASLVGSRAVIRLRYLRKTRRRADGTGSTDGREDIIIVGLNSVAELFLRCVSECGLQAGIAGILSDGARHRGRFLRSYPILGRPDEIERIIRELDIHGVRISRIVVAVPFHALPVTAQESLRQVEQELDIRLDLIHDRFRLDDPGATALDNAESDIGLRASCDWLSIATESNRQTSHAYLLGKRCFDILVATLCIFAFAPLMLLLAAVVLLDVGHPIIFWQQRPGTRGIPIKVLKFRTMRSARDAEGRRLSDAERLSPVGLFLRRMRLDELPQIYNVLLGQMSMIGPRPLLPIDQSPRFIGRLQMRPGLTGWAQINGGRRLSIHDKAALDLWYVKNASIGIDCRILFMTVRTVLFGERINRTAIREAWRALGPAPDAGQDAMEMIGSPSLETLASSTLDRI